MALLVCVTCAALSALSSWLALGGGVSRSPGAWGSLLLHALRRALGLLASTRLVDALVSRSSIRAIADDLRDKTSAHLALNTSEEAVAALVLTAGAGSVLGALACSSLVGAFVVLGLMAMAVAMRHTSRTRVRARELSASMPGVFRTLATAIGAGQTLVQAIEYVGIHERGPAGDGFVRTSLRLRCGMSVDDALSCLTEELDAPGIGLMATALSISQRTGSPLRDLFERSAQLVEQQGEFERMLAVRTAQVRLSVRVVCSLPPALVGLLSLISPDYRAGLATPTGLGCLALAASMDGIALLAIHRIMGSVL